MRGGPLIFATAHDARSLALSKTLVMGYKTIITPIYDLIILRVASYCHVR